MSLLQFLEPGDGRRIAYRRIAGESPGIVFLGGFRSDMNGTKAEWLETWAAQRGQAFLRFDYTGHGQSSGDFEFGTISDWLHDAVDALERLTRGPQILVGSSMGGWIALLLAKRMPQRVAGLVGIAAAPDFTEDLMWASWDEPTRALLRAEGRLTRESAYDPEPDVVTIELIEDGRKNLVMRDPLELPFPVRLLHGNADADVPVSTALGLLEHARGKDIRLTLVKDADHRFSSEECLALLGRSVGDILAGHIGQGLPKRRREVD